MVTSLILTSRENFVWDSMQEIIPQIEKSWMESSRQGLHEVRCLDVDQVSLPEIISAALSADNIVLPCFTVKLSRIAVLLRKQFSLDFRLFFYLHNQATIACWPLREWGLCEALRTHDILISSCSLDAEAVKYVFVKCRSEVIPFGLSEALGTEPARSKVRVGDGLFVYVGRLSPQKNLHLLLFSFRLLLDQSPGLRIRLEIFGKEDDRGSPNMGMDYENYEAYLRDLCKSLGLDDFVKFVGHWDRKNLYTHLEQTPHVFVSPSLHSDENFGMAAFSSLCLGNPAVLSAWGGHVDFTSHFSEQVFSVQVHEGPMGPFLDPRQLADKLREALSRYGHDFTQGMPSYYHRENISNRLFKLAVEDAEPGSGLEYTAEAEKIFLDRARYLGDSAKLCKIFYSYRDPSSQPFFRAYGMRTVEGRPELEKVESLRILPWVSVQNGSVEIADPHRGHHRIAYLDQGAHVSTLTLDAAREVIECGYGFIS